MNATQTNPFAGLKRRRLPGMHLITAVDGGAPLDNSLAAFFFMMLHAHYPHTCLIEQAKAEVTAATHEAVHGSSSPDGMFLGGIFGNMAQSGLALEEWSYLSDEEAFSLLLLAGNAAEQTQRWIWQGVESPYTIPLGQLVTRPDWAVAYFDDPGRIQLHQEAVDQIALLRREVDKD